MASKKKLTNSASRRSVSRQVKLAAAVILCWTLAANTDVSATNTLHGLFTDLHSEAPKPAVLALNTPKNVQVLSPKDADLYRAIFTAQSKADWKEADRIIANLNNKGLMGHVLADRYSRQQASADELKVWLTSYADLPEASDIYDQAKQLPGARGLKLTKPFASSHWSGGDSTRSVAPSFKDILRAKAIPSADRIKRALHRGEPYLAEAYVDAGQKRHPLNEQDLAPVKARVAASFFYKGQIDDAHRLAKEAALRDPLGGWIAGLTAWKKNDAREASDDFARLAAMPGLGEQDRSAAAFWAYRSYARIKNTKEADYWLKQAAIEPHSFYGLLASNLLGHNNKSSWQMPVLSEGGKEVLAKQKAGWRALALLQVGQTNLAEGELSQLNPQGRHDLQEAMLAIADAEHMPSISLRLAGVAVNGNGKPYDGASYPLPPWQPAEGFQVDRALLYALMRHESRFDPMAISGSGACGLMQLMPATAKILSGAQKWDASVNNGDCTDSLLDPATNMGLGQSYVQRLADQPAIGNNLLFLLAAYNGGPNRLEHWIDTDQTKDPLLFMESLPVRETRDYIQQVLVHYWMYRERLGEPQPSLHQLAHGEWPRIKIRNEEAPQLPRMIKAEIGGFTVASSSN
jgi:soluble lytic murein transglycosylase